MSIIRGSEEDRARFRDQLDELIETWPEENSGRVAVVEPIDHPRWDKGSPIRRLLEYLDRLDGRKP